MIKYVLAGLAGAALAIFGLILNEITHNTVDTIEGVDNFVVAQNIRNMEQDNWFVEECSFRADSTGTTYGILCINGTKWLLSYHTTRQMRGLDGLPVACEKGDTNVTR